MNNEPLILDKKLREHLIENGWKPPIVTEFDPWRPALAAFWGQKGFHESAKAVLAGRTLDHTDKENINAIAAAQPFMPPMVSGGSEAPHPPASEPIMGEGANAVPSPKWIEKLGEFVEGRTEAFTTDEAVEAAGLNPNDVDHALDVIRALRARADITTALVRNHKNMQAEERWARREVA